MSLAASPIFVRKTKGFGKLASTLFRDPSQEIVRVLANNDPSKARTKYFAESSKPTLPRDLWGQQDFLIVSRQVTAL